MRCPRHGLPFAFFSSQARCPAFFSLSVIAKKYSPSKRAWRTAVAQSGIYEAQMALSRETKTLLTEAADSAIEVLYLQEQEAKAEVGKP